MSGKFELKQSIDGQFHFNLKARNGEVILSSELYTARHSAEAGIESVKVNAVADERYERKSSKNGEPYFVLRAANGGVIGRSELYSSTKAMENGIDAVKRNAPEAILEDLTEKAKGKSG